MFFILVNIKNFNLSDYNCNHCLNGICYYSEEISSFGCKCYDQYSDKFCSTFNNIKLDSVVESNEYGGKVQLNGNFGSRCQESYFNVSIGGYNCQIKSVNENSLVCYLNSILEPSTKYNIIIKQLGLIYEKESFYEPIKSYKDIKIINKLKVSNGSIIGYGWFSENYDDIKIIYNVDEDSSIKELNLTYIDSIKFIANVNLNFTTIENIQILNSSTSSILYKYTFEVYNSENSINHNQISITKFKSAPSNGGLVILYGYGWDDDNNIRILIDGYGCWVNNVNTEYISCKLNEHLLQNTSYNIQIVQNDKYWNSSLYIPDDTNSNNDILNQDNEYSNILISISIFLIVIIAVIFL